MKRLLLACVVTTGLLTCSAGEARALLIDSFDVTTQLTFAPDFGAIGPESSAVATEAVGGRRDLRVTNDGGSGFPNVLTANDSAFGMAGRLVYDEPSGRDGSFSVFWDAMDPDLNPTTVSLETAVGLGGIDITDGGANNIFHVRASSVSGATLTFNIYSSTANFSTTDIPVPTNTLQLTDFFVHLNDFTVGGGTGATFTSVTAVELFHNNSTNDTDVTIDLIQTIPEPSSIALLGMGAFGLVGYGWRRKRKQPVTETVA